MGKYTREHWNAKKLEIMEKCFDGFADLGLHGTGLRTLTDYCGYTTSTVYTYFENLDDLIVQATAHSISRIERDLMRRAPKNVADLWRFIDEIPYWTAKKHGKKYRLIYQIYTHPKYIKFGQEFFAGVNGRYSEYAKRLEEKLGIPYQRLTSLIFIFIRACVHYALFEDEFYLKAQVDILKEALELFIMKYNPSVAKSALTVKENSEGISP